MKPPERSVPPPNEIVAAVFELEEDLRLGVLAGEAEVEVGLGVA